VRSQLWLIRGALSASAAALLATSAPVPNVPQKTYEFERTVAGESVALTLDQPSALFLITIRADALGPDGVQSTEQATVRVAGSISASEVEGEAPPVSVLVGSNQLDAETSFGTTIALVFEGTCDGPAESAPCQASFSVQFARKDDGTRGGSVTLDWSFELTSSGVVAGKGEDQAGLDPPWTVEVEQP
jgi:hypothetical protein